MGAGQRLAGGADGVQLIGFAAPAAGALGPVRLDHRVPGRGEGGGQAGAVGTAALDRPGDLWAR